MCYTKHQMARMVGCEPRDLAFIENATTGTNIVLKSQQLSEGDVILTLSLSYGKVSMSPVSTPADAMRY